MTNLSAYLLAAMVAWVPPKLQPEGEAEALGHYAEVANDVAAGVTDADEPPLFDRDVDRHLSGLEIISIAASESSFFARVDRGECRPNECDGGLAVGLWQVHTEAGILLEGTGWRLDPKGFHGRDFIRDRRIAVRVAIHLVRRTPDARWSGGERLERAMAWAVSHPYAP